MKITAILIALILPYLQGCHGSAEPKAASQKVITEKAYFKTWNHYLGDPERTHFSGLDEITSENVDQLKPAWSYHSGGLTADRNTQIQTNPLIIGNKLFGVNPSKTLFAVRAETGEELWTFSPTEVDETGQGQCRGVIYWQGDADKKSRLFFASGYLLYAIDLSTGAVIDTFGDQGHIDLRNGLGRDPEKTPIIATTPGVIYDSLYIMGFRTAEGPRAAPGHIRAFNVLTGAIEWVFHTIPQPGEFGYQTWPKDAYQKVGGANNWSGMALDQARGIVYVPTGSAAFDWYGGDRIGDNLFANSLVALNAKTGKRIWHFQMVRHDLWDRDLPAPPNLLEVERDGKKIPAVAQITKSGHVFVFNRVSGEPLFPIEEKPYPATSLEGDETSKTQPLPLKPAPFARQALGEEDLYDPDRPAFVDNFFDKDQLTVREKFQQVTSNGQFMPIDTTGVIIYPGLDGGAEWGGAAVDPRNGIMYVNASEMAWIVRMEKVGETGGKKLSAGATLAHIHCARCHGGEFQGLGDSPNLQEVHTRLAKAEITSSIKKGRGAMPAMPNLSEEQIEAIVDYFSKTEQKENATETDQRKEVAIDAPYGVGGLGRFKDDRGYPAVKPPWGTLNAIDLNTGEYLWKIPLGNEEDLNDPDYPVSGTENYGGPVITAGGVLFIAATKDEKFRAFHMKTGKLLWETDLPAGGYATPATYEVNGKQYVVIGCGGGKMGTPSGDVYLAFSL